MVVDAFEFARQQEYREGQIKIADFARLAKECADAATVLNWSLRGGVGKFGHPQLILSVKVIVQPLCQRCLLPFELDILSDSTLILARNETEADKIEEMLDDEEVDVIVGSKEMNLRDLIEDEVLLALPLSPRHEICPDTTKLDEIRTSKPSPFAALKSLKK